jgi:23S rRNA U2552 (ribose-2'-O)-methylase RlmE/FtsJ
MPTVEIIYGSIFDKDTKDFVFNDVGQDPIDTISPEEYNSMSGVHIIPNSIESKD